jgi:hypothetical protein
MYYMMYYNVLNIPFWKVGYPLAGPVEKATRSQIVAVVVSNGFSKRLSGSIRCNRSKTTAMGAQQMKLML